MTLVVPAAGRGQRLDQYLATAVAELSRSRLRALIDDGHVQVDRAVMKAGHRLKGGESISVNVPAPVAAEPEAQDLDIEVIFEDRDLLIVNKAPGMVVHPGAGNHDGTLVNALLHRVKDFKGVGGVLRPGIVHRLDKDTSGLMVVAKKDSSLEVLQAAFAEREVEKIYLALVKGAPPPSGTFRTLYGRHPRQRLKFSSKVKTGKSAVTHFTTVKKFARASLVEVTLETGRTHQIRVHFADAGFPLLADTLYGGRQMAKDAPMHRQALHAWKLSFVHPRTGKQVSFEAPLPDDFSAALQTLESDDAD